MSTFTEDGGNYHAERPEPEPPDLSWRDYDPPLLSGPEVKWTGATCRGCGRALTEATTACVVDDCCDECGPIGDCLDCRDAIREEAADKARRAQLEDELDAHGRSGGGLGWF